MAWQNEGKVLFPMEKRGIIEEDDGGEDIDGKEANNGEKDAEGLSPHLHGAQGNPGRTPTRTPTRSIRHRQMFYVNQFSSPHVYCQLQCVNQYLVPKFIVNCNA